MDQHSFRPSGRITARDLSLRCRAVPKRLRGRQRRCRQLQAIDRRLKLHIRTLLIVDYYHPMADIDVDRRVLRSMVRPLPEPQACV